MALSRIAKRPIVLPKDVTVKIDDENIVVTGPKGHLSLPVQKKIAVNLEKSDDENRTLLTIEEAHEKSAKSIAGTMRASLNNLVLGVTQGFTKKLLLVGVGYRAQVKSTVLVLHLGYSHPIEYTIPEGIKIDTPAQTEIVITGLEKRLVGQAAAEIRSFRKPEVYKGKGVKYEDERLELKETKKK